MKLETIVIDRLIPYARNSRTHSDEQVAQIAASIREFGFTNPVLIDGQDGIIAGHGRVLGARKLGMYRGEKVSRGKEQAPEYHSGLGGATPTTTLQASEAGDDGDQPDSGGAIPTRTLHE